MLTVLLGITLDQDVSAVLYLNVYFHCCFFFYFASSTVFNANGDIILYFWLLHICTNTLCSCNITGTVVAILVLARLYKLLVSDLLSLTYTYHISHTKINNRGFFKFFRYNFFEYPLRRLMFLIVNLYTLHKVGQQDDNSYKIVFAKSNNNSSISITFLRNNFSEIWIFRWRVA